jgi:hypothetical protein
VRRIALALTRGRPSFRRAAVADARLKLQKWARVEGTLTSGSGFGAIGRPLTDWPTMGARRGGGRASILSFRGAPESALERRSLR